LEVSDAGEHLSKLRKRVALARFYDSYTFAGANPYNFLAAAEKDQAFDQRFRSEHEYERIIT
jgi:hypothetical protein